MDKIDLDELERLHKAATPGPWTQRGNFISCAQNKRLAYVEAERALDLQTAAYIVAACNSLPELIAENRALQERAQMRQELVEQYEQDIARLRQKVRELEAELEAYKQPIDFPKLRESVGHVDNSLSDFLEDSIKRAAARP